MFECTHCPNSTLFPTEEDLHDHQDHFALHWNEKPFSPTKVTPIKVNMIEPPRATTIDETKFNRKSLDTSSDSLDDATSLDAQPIKPVFLTMIHARNDGAKPNPRLFSFEHVTDTKEAGQHEKADIVDDGDKLGLCEVCERAFLSTDNFICAHCGIACDGLALEETILPEEMQGDFAENSRIVEPERLQAAEEPTEKKKRGRKRSELELLKDGGHELLDQSKSKARIWKNVAANNLTSSPKATSSAKAKVTISRIKIIRIRAKQTSQMSKVKPLRVQLERLPESLIKTYQKGGSFYKVESGTAIKEQINQAEPPKKKKRTGDSGEL